MCGLINKLLKCSKGCNNLMSGTCSRPQRMAPPFTLDCFSQQGHGDVKGLTFCSALCVAFHLADDDVGPRKAPKTLRCGARL